MYGFLKSESTYDSANILTGKKEMAYDNEKESVMYGEPMSIKTYTSENTALEEKREYNGQGQMVKSINPRGYATQYLYDSYGIYPVSVVNAKGQEEQYVYDYRV